MNTLSISIPQQRAVFSFGRDAVALPVDFKIDHFRLPEEIPKFELSFRTLTQEIRVSPTRGEMLQIARFLAAELKPVPNAQHQSDE
jgi:hypothetical protein